MGIGQGSPWMSCQLIAGPLLMASVHQEQLWGSVSCSRILRYVAQFCPGDLLITSPPTLPTELQLDCLVMKLSPSVVETQDYLHIHLRRHRNRNHRNQRQSTTKKYTSSL